MKRVGKVGREWLRVRREWVQLNPANHQGYYVCSICGKWMHSSEMELDHIISRSRAPEFRFELGNLQPTCHSCNTKKGSGASQNPG